MTIRPTNPLLVQASALIEHRTGLAASALFRVNLEAILNDLAGGNLARLVQTLHDTPETSPIWQRLLSELSIGETYFFRHQTYFKLFKNYILPDIITQRRDRPFLNIWSAGCATGEETYSIAICLRETLTDLPRWRLRLLGSDINARAIEAARAGVYRRWAFRHTDTAFQERYFTPTPQGMQIIPAVRAMALFQQGNLLDGPPLHELDVIFCCNVLIYFDDAYTRRAETMFYDALAPGGWLVLGQAEMLHSQRDRWQMHLFPDVVLYQKPGVSASEAPQQYVKPTSQFKAVPQQPPPSTYPDAVAALRAKHYAEAERLLAAILTDNPDNAPAHVLLGCLFANRHAIPEAQTHLDAALRLDPLQADAHYLRGMLHLENQQTAAALEALRAALYCRRGHTLAAMVLGHLYTQSGDVTRARRTWEEALAALNGQPAENPVSDISDLTVGDAAAFLTTQLKG